MEEALLIPVRISVLMVHGEIIILEFVKVHVQMDHMLIINHGYV